MTDRNKSISLVFPMFNEKGYLQVAVETAQSVLKEISSDYEIIIVDDASTDGSGQMAEEMSRRDERIRVIHHPKNRKLGGALKTGFHSATKEIVVYTDIDLPFDLSLLKDIFPLTYEFDIIKGFRLGHRESWLRIAYSQVYNKLINFLFALNLKDVNFSLKIFRREILDKIELKSEGSFIDAEFMAKAKKLGYSIKKIGVEYRPRTRGISRLSSAAVILKILYEMVMLYSEIRSFSPEGLLHSRLKNLYRKTNPPVKLYNALRLKTCPFNTVARFVPAAGTVVDLGCGTGLFLNLLRQNSQRDALFGFDTDMRKISAARVSLQGSADIAFERIDVVNSESNFPRAACITLIDVLHYFSVDQKKLLLNRCVQSLDSGGTLIIKDIEKGLSLKFIWTLFQESLAVKIFRLTKAERLCFEDKHTCLSLLKEVGLVVETFDLSKGYLYPHILYVCKKQ